MSGIEFVAGVLFGLIVACICAPAESEEDANDRKRILLDSNGDPVIGQVLDEVV